MWRNTTDATSSRLMMAGFRRCTLRMRAENVQRPRPRTRRRGTFQLSTLNHRLRHSTARSALALAAASRSSGTRARESSRLRWNSSPSGRMAVTSRIENRESVVLRTIHDPRITIHGIRSRFAIPVPNQLAIGDRQLEIPSLPNSSAMKSRAAAQSSPRTSITPNLSR